MLQAVEHGLNGLITNDKFCLSRTGRLALSWWRYPLRLRDPAPEGTDTVPDLEGDRGGGHETPLAGSPSDAAGFGRRSAVGSGLHAHSELGSGRHGLGARGGSATFRQALEVSHEDGPRPQGSTPRLLHLDPGSQGDNRPLHSLFHKTPAKLGSTSRRQSRRANPSHTSRQRTCGAAPRRSAGTAWCRFPRSPPCPPPSARQ